MVCIELPGENTWTTGVCMDQSGPRSYKVKGGDQEYCRNQRQLIQTKEPPPLPDIQTTPDHSRLLETTPETNPGDTLETTPTQSNDSKIPALPVEPRQSSRIQKKSWNGLVNMQKIAELETLTWLTLNNYNMFCSKKGETLHCHVLIVLPTITSSLMTCDHVIM